MLATRQCEGCAMKRLLILGALIAVAVLGAVAPAFASIGVGTDMRSIEVTQPLVAGGTYQLHSFTIINTGSQPSGFGIQTSPTSKPGLRVPTSWLTFEPSAFYLSPKQGIDVKPTLHVSLDATGGVYEVYLLGVPKLAGDLAPGGHMNVGVGPRLSFTVVQPNQWQRLQFLFLGWMPWSAIAALALLVLVVAGLWLAIWRARARNAHVDPTDSQDADAGLSDVGAE